MPDKPPEIPEPTREDLLNLAHADERQLFESGDIPAKNKDQILDGLRRQWYDGYNAQLHAANSEKDSLSNDEKETCTRVPGQQRAPTKQGERREASDPISPLDEFNRGMDEAARAAALWRQQQAENRFKTAFETSVSDIRKAQEKAKEIREQLDSEKTRLANLPAHDPLAEVSEEIEERRARTRQTDREIAEILEHDESDTSREPSLPGPSEPSRVTTELQLPMTPDHEKKVAWFHRIPVWKEFGPWLKWASAGFGFAVAMTQVNEYGWALAGLVFCGVCCLGQIYVWTASPNSFRNTTTTIVFALLSVSIIAIAWLTVLNIKGEKPWSNLLSESKQPVPSSTVKNTPTLREQFLNSPSMFNMPIRPTMCFPPGELPIKIEFRLVFQYDLGIGHKRVFVYIPATRNTESAISNCVGKDPQHWAQDIEKRVAGNPEFESADRFLLLRGMVIYHQSPLFRQTAEALERDGHELHGARSPSSIR